MDIGHSLDHMYVNELMYQNPNSRMVHNLGRTKLNLDSKENYRRSSYRVDYWLSCSRILLYNDRIVCLRRFVYINTGHLEYYVDHSQENHFEHQRVHIYIPHNTEN